MQKRSTNLMVYATDVEVHVGGVYIMTPDAITITATTEALGNWLIHGLQVYAHPTADDPDYAREVYVAGACSESDFILAYPDDFWEAEGWTWADMEGKDFEATKDDPHTLTVPRRTRVEKHARQFIAWREEQGDEA